MAHNMVKVTSFCHTPRAGRTQTQPQFGESIYNDMTKIFTETETGKHPQSLHTVSKPMI